MDIFKAVANVGSKLIPLVSPLLDPVGGILGSLAESEMSKKPYITNNSTAERVILAEAALQAVLASEHTEALTYYAQGSIMGPRVLTILGKNIITGIIKWTAISHQINTEAY
ncbi:unnamed protein product [Clonostachys rhizophaga]|uniref:Uncharacterized protein n=1 Tax=Clonostachys rhizophaga TaxID=160324 RepID=A0A9N9VV57_9HYPO|nr:unnamed protein product [Clonostachys rhizophaga]